MKSNRSKRKSIIKRISALGLALVMILSMISTNFGQGPIEVDAAGNYVSGGAGKTYYDYGTCSVVNSSSTNGHGWKFTNFSSKSGSSITLEGFTAPGECASYSTYSSNTDSKSHGVSAPVNEGGYYYAVGKTTSETVDGVEGIRITWTMYFAPYRNGDNADHSNYITSVSEWKARTPDVQHSQGAFLGTVTKSVSAQGQTSRDVTLTYKDLTVTVTVKFDTDGHVTSFSLDGYKDNPSHGTDGGYVYNIGCNSTNGKDADITMYVYKRVRSWRGGNTFAQLGLGGVSEWNPSEIYINGAKASSASNTNVPSGLEDSYLYSPHNNTGTTQFTIYYKDGNTYKEVDPNGTGDVISIQSGTYESKDKAVTISASLFGKTFYAKETKTNGTYQCTTNPTKMRVRIGSGDWSDDVSVNSDGYFKIGTLSSSDAGSTFTIKFFNEVESVDPAVSVVKHLPNGTLAPVAGARYRVQYFDTLDSSDDSKYLYLSALNKDSAKAAAVDTNSHSGATKSSYYTDTYINDSNVFPNNVTGIKSALTNRANSAISKANNGSLELSNYNSDNYREWQFKTITESIGSNTYGYLSLARGYIDRCYVDGDPLFTWASGTYAAPAGTYVITEYKGTSGYYANMLDVIIIHVENGSTSSSSWDDVTYTAYSYNGDGSNASASLSSVVNSGTYNAAVVATGTVDLTDLATNEIQTEEPPKAGSLSIEKTLADNLPTTNRYYTGYGQDATHDGDNDANIDNLTVTMALYYDSDTTGYYYPQGVQTNADNRTELHKGDLVTTFTINKKTQKVTATGNPNVSAHANADYADYVSDYATANNRLGNYTYDFPDMSLSVGQYYLIETNVSNGLINSHPDKASSIPITIEADKRTFKTTDYQYTASGKDESVGNAPVEGQVFVRKVVDEVDTLAGAKAAGIGEGDAHLKGGIFYITNRSKNAVWVSEMNKWYEVGEIVGYMTTAEDGTSSTIYAANSGSTTPNKSNISGTAIKLPYGSYQITEYIAPAGLQVDAAFNTRNANSSNYIVITTNGQTFEFEYKSGAQTVAKEPIDRGGFSIEKVDAETGLRIPQGNGQFDDARFIIKNLSDYPVWVDLNNDGKETDDEWFAGTKLAGVTSNGTVIQPVAGGTDIVCKNNKYALDNNGKTTDAYTFRLDALSYDGNPGYFASPVDFLPYGTYEIREVASVDNNDPVGYHINAEWRYTLTLRKDKQWDAITVTTDTLHTPVTNQGSPVPDTPARGGFQIQKYDKEDNGITKQGDATLEGAVFAIYNTSAYKDAAFYGDMNGYVVTDINNDGTLSDSEKTTYFKSVTDAQINEAIANGLSTTTWAGKDNAGNDVVPCLIIKTDANGIAKTSSIALPYGDYVVREVQAPEGYHIDRNFNMHVIVTDEVTTVTETSASNNKQSEYKIPCDILTGPHSGKMSVITGAGANYTATPIDYDDDRYNATLSESKASAYDAIIRGSFVLQKVDKDDYEAYKNGETLYLDSDGKYVIEPQGDAVFSNVKFRVINRSDAPIYTLTYTADGESVYTKVDVDAVAWEFMTDDNGYYEAPDDLLPYGTYEIQEVDPSVGYKLTEQTDMIFTIGYEDSGRETIIDINEENAEDTPENDLSITMDGYVITKISAGKYQITNKATGKLVTNKKFTISNAADNDDIYIWTNVVGGPNAYTKYAPGAKIYDTSTDANGIFVLRQLTAGQYGTDYTISGDIKGTLHVSLDDYTAKFLANLTTNDNYDLYPVEEPVIRGGLEVLKIDEDDYLNTGEHNGPQGDATLEGAEFSIYNISDHYVWVSDEEGNWRRTYPATTDGKWIPQDDVEADVVYDPEEALTRIAWDRVNEITSTGMINGDKSTVSDNGAYTDTIAAFNGATSAEVIEKYHQNDLARLGNNDLQDLLENTVPVKKIYTDRDGYARTGNYDLPYGTYVVVETKSSTGYMLPRCWYRIVEIREDGHMYTWEETNTAWTPNVDTKETLEPVIRGDVQITKFDAELDTSNALNNGALDGIEFKIYNVSDQYTYLWELTNYKNEPLVDTDDEKYNTPLKIVNSDYFNPDTSDFWNNLDSDPSNYVTTITTKWNPSTQSYTAETYVRNEDGTKKDVDDDGSTIRGALPYGTYLIRESKTNTKYEFTDGDAWIFQIREEGDVVTIGFQSGDTSAENKAHQITFKDFIERNDVWFNKIGDGDSVRMDTMWVIKNEDTGERHVIVTNGGSDDDNNGNGTYESGADVNAHTYHTNANDKFLEYIDANKLLESGTPFITEADAKANGNEDNKAVAITMGSENKHIQTEDKIVPGQKDPEKVVISDDGLNNNGLGYAEYDAGTWFGWCEFTVVESGTSVNPYILNGTAEEEIITVDETTGEQIILHWADPDDSLKAFPYGHYSISEVRTDTNADYTLQKYSFTINNSNTDLTKWVNEVPTHDREVDLGTITDDFPPVIETELIDAETESHLYCAKEKTNLIETVNYQFFGGDIFKKDYKVKGELYVLSEDGTTVEGDPIATAESKTFQLKTLTGSQEIEYTDVDTSAYAGRTLVSYAYLYKIDENGNEVLEASHTDAEDTEEQVSSPVITTTFIASLTGDKDVPVGANVTLRDTIHAEKLVRGRYAVSGTLMTVDADGNATAVLDADGNEITAKSAYVYVSSGETEKDFTLTFKGVDTTNYQGQYFVAYAELLTSDMEIAIHHDIEDLDETVYIPEIHTDAVDGVSGDQQGVCIEADSVVDTITYKNLTVGKTYKAVGELFEVDAEGNAVPLMIGEGEESKAVTAEIEFVPEETEGQTSVEFNIDARTYAGKTLVVYETLYAAVASVEDDTTDETEEDATDSDAEEAETVWVELISHKDSTDERQTVWYPEIHTTATDANTETKSALAIEDAEIIDTITYHNLIPGNSYVFSGTLMTVDDEGNVVEVVNNGKPVTAKTDAITVETADGTQDVVFHFDATEYKGKDIVVYEKLLSGVNTDIEYTSHEDIEDEDQTLHYPEIGTTAKDSQTGENFGYATENTTIIDTVHYQNLVSGVTYELVGTLYDKETGKPVGVVETESDEESDTTEDASTTEETVTTEEDTTEEMTEADATTEDADISEEDTEETTTEETVTEEDTTEADETDTDASEEATTEGTTTEADTEDATETDAETTGSTEKYVTNTVQFTATGKDGDVDVPLTFNAIGFEGRDVVVFEKLYVVKPDGTRVEIPLAEHEDLEDEGQTIHYPKIGTEAYNAETLLHESEAGKELVITDMVRYENVVPGVEYTVTGKLMNQKTEQPLLDAEGKEIISTVTVTPEEANGEVAVEFKFDASYLRGETAVAFETWSYEEFPLAVHADIKDAPQTVYFPDIHTTATSQASGSKLLDPIDVEVVEDEIYYENVIVGHTYIIKGSLVDVETGEALKDADGKAIENTVEFTAETTEGYIKMDFGAIKASELKGKSIVVYEALYNHDGKDDIILVTEHETTNTDQTVDVTNPSVKTLLCEAETENKAIAADSEVKLIDTIEYTDLIPGNTYKTVSTLVYADSGEVVKDNKGKEIVVDATITPDKSSVIGTAEFTFDGSNLAGKTVVAYEDVYRVIDGKEYLVAQERDLKNEDQTITFPDIHTTATSQATQTHTLELAEKAVIIDRVTYSGLQPGHTYKLTGTLMDKETKKAVAGVEPVTLEFTPGESDGFVDVSVTVDTTKLQGHKLVMFETLYENDRELVIHADIEDEDQTVTVSDIQTKATGKDGKSKTVAMAKDTVIKDTVTFTGLTPGQTYILTGEVYSREAYTGTSVDGKKPTTTEATTTAGTTETTTTEATTAATTTETAENSNPFTEEGAVKTTTSNGVMIEIPITVGDNTIPENRMVFDKAVIVKLDNKLTLMTGMHMTSRIADNTSDTWSVTAKCLDSDANVIKNVTISVNGIKDATASSSFSSSVGVPSNTAKILIMENPTDATLNPLPAGSTTEATTETTTEATTEAGTTEGQIGAADTNPTNVKPLATNTIEFTPKEADGEVTIEFTVDTTGLDGQHLVCFETVTDKASGTVIGEHKDINDKDQTVTVKTTTTVQTGVDRFALLFTILSMLLLLATAGVFVYFKKHQEKLVVKSESPKVIHLDDYKDE